MFDQKYLNILNEQRLNLLEKKKNSKFFKRIFFRNYTKWLKTDEIVSHTSCFRFGSPIIKQKRIYLRMDIHNGNIEKIEKKEFN